MLFPYVSTGPEHLGLERTYEFSWTAKSSSSFQNFAGWPRLRVKLLSGQKELIRVGRATSGFSLGGTSRSVLFWLVRVALAVVPL